MFCSRWERGNGYYIDFLIQYDNYFDGVSDEDIAKGIGISDEEYIEILKKYNAKEVKIPLLSGVSRYQYYFDKEQDCLDCVNYLNETYGLLVILKGE
jgi:hypothetical protein